MNLDPEGDAAMRLPVTAAIVLFASGLCARPGDGDGDTLEDGLTLDITGPASFAPTKIADGSITLTDVKTVNLTDFKGAVTIAGDVESFTSNSLVSLSVTAGAKLETVDVTGVADPDAALSNGASDQLCRPVG